MDRYVPVKPRRAAMQHRRYWSSPWWRPFRQMSAYLLSTACRRATGSAVRCWVQKTWAAEFAPKFSTSRPVQNSVDNAQKALAHGPVRCLSKTAWMVSLFRARYFCFASDAPGEPFPGAQHRIADALEGAATVCATLGTE
jgi:hypothetical protein